jgi:asparagine synthase (glutamine-hydrolysing)
MVSISGRYVLVFNGEIYNHRDLRLQLDLLGISSETDVTKVWRGHSDTETVLAAVELWGIDKALKSVIGMFAMALWDRQERTLTLARDRLGEKPLYYGWQGGVLLFGSELKALRKHPAFQSEVDWNVVPLYMRHGYIPAPWSVWRGIFKLLPGSWVKFREDQQGQSLTPISYWCLRDVILRGQSEPFSGSDSEAVDLLEDSLSRAVAAQQLSDVPVGAFLSGGIDSSTIVALMQAKSHRPVKTFTIGFNEAGYNEATHAKLIAAHLRTDHSELYVDDSCARKVIPSLSEMYDEPFGDSSAIPTYLVSQLARQQVAVSLSGDGGDELFAGYGRYFNDSMEQTRKMMRRCIPEHARGIALTILRSNGLKHIDEVLARCLQAAGLKYSKSILSACETRAGMLECRSRIELYRLACSYWPQITRQSQYSKIILEYGYNDFALMEIIEEVHRMMAIDTVTYLPDDILVKVDRAAMSVSLETRVPMLDHRVVGLAWRFPYSMKVRDGRGKWILRQLLYRYVPPNLVERPKMGFGVPVATWLRGPLHDWADALINSPRFLEGSSVDPKTVRRRWQEHLKGQQNWGDSLWIAIMWQAWIESIGRG